MAFINKNQKPDIVFISGTGRSGTHLIGETIATHPEVVGRIEEKETFRLITELATGQADKPWWINRYKKWRLKSKMQAVISKESKIVLEKSHPSLWLAEDLMNWFTNCKFILIYRSPEATVSSMLDHKGVMKWYQTLSQDTPNAFLGITSKNKPFFQNLKKEEKCALRWKSHKREIDRLDSLYPDQTLTINYEKFINKPDYYIGIIAEFIGVSKNFELDQIKTSSLDKWKQRLTQEQLHRIEEILQTA